MALGQVQRGERQQQGRERSDACPKQPRAQQPGRQQRQPAHQQADPPAEQDHPADQRAPLGARRRRQIDPSGPGAQVHGERGRDRSGAIHSCRTSG